VIQQWHRATPTQQAGTEVLQQVWVGAETRLTAQALECLPTGAGTRSSGAGHGGGATGAITEHEAAEPHALARYLQGIAAGLSQGGMAFAAVLSPAEARNADHSTHPS
jgi:hypothetical protein